MGHHPNLPMPDRTWDETGLLVTDQLFRHFSSELFSARDAFKRAMQPHLDPVLREAVRLHNARTLDCEH